MFNPYSSPVASVVSRPAFIAATNSPESIEQQYRFSELHQTAQVLLVESLSGYIQKEGINPANMGTLTGSSGPLAGLAKVAWHTAEAFEAEARARAETRGLVSAVSASNGSASRR